MNQHAGSVLTHRWGSVAFILPEPQERLFEDPNFPVLLYHCTRALAEHDIPLLLAIAGDDADRKRLVRFIAAGHFDGALLVSAHARDPLVGELIAHRVAVVAAGQPLGHERDVAYVGVDDRASAGALVRYLRGQGRQRIGIITGPMDTVGGTERLAGYRDVLAGAGLPELVAHGDFSERSGEIAMEQLLAAAPDLDAVFAASDLMARGALHALRRAGRQVPHDVAVAGFDDSRVAATADPPLTTVRQPWARIGAEMVRLLLAAIAGASQAAVTLPTELVVRASA